MYQKDILHKTYKVTSLVEVWIEIAILSAQDRMECRHFPCGSVD